MNEVNSTIIELPAIKPGLLDTAIAVAHAAHADQFRSSGPYIEHPRAVAEALDSEHLKILAWLHDVMEDHPGYHEAWMRHMFPAWVVDHLLLLTHRKDETYDAYILRAMSNHATRAVKLADLRHNLIGLEHGHQRDKYRLALRLMGEVP